MIKSNFSGALVLVLLFGGPARLAAPTTPEHPTTTTVIEWADQFDADTALVRRVLIAADHNRIPAAVAMGLVYTESRFNPSARGAAGEVGLVQILPSTARGLHRGITIQALFDPSTNLDLGFRFLRTLVDRYNGDLWLALMAYNRGPAAGDRLRIQFKYAHQILHYDER